MIAKAIQTLKPGAQWVLRGNDYSGLEWLDTVQTQPTSDEITAEIARLEQEYIDTEYQRDRIKAYTELNQFEMQFDDSVNGTNTWIEAINTIKAQYPKPV